MNPDQRVADIGEGSRLGFPSRDVVNHIGQLYRIFIQFLTSAARYDEIDSGDASFAAVGYGREAVSSYSDSSRFDFVVSEIGPGECQVAPDAGGEGEFIVRVEDIQAEGIEF